MTGTREQVEAGALRDCAMLRQSDDASRAVASRFAAVSRSAADKLTPIQNSGSRNAIEPGTHIRTPAAA